MEKKFNFTVLDEDEGKRLDKFLASQSLNLSRTYIARLIREEKARVNDKVVKPSYSLRAGDLINVTVPPPEKIDIKPEDIPLNIVYEDEHLLIVDKEVGMVVHPAPGHYDGTLVNALLFHCGNLSSINGFLRPGIIHRLDKDTSGLLLVAKEDYTHLKLVESMQKREIKRRYKTVVHGIIEPAEGRIEGPIARHPRFRKKMAVVRRRGKDAVTLYKTIKIWENYSFLEVELLTGRTHQIRVHLAYKGYPVVGDKIYGRLKQDELDKLIGRQALHAYELKFVHPVTNEEKLFQSPLPLDMERIVGEKGVTG
ncbi:MAG: RluA family pseudouridine synthase [Candidatus Omnitrophica bacterium]|nr:RluA family pseudouridine synthase [Candidatus Omnitrophota bacterium]